MTASVPLIPASWGEVIDKITILEIKSARISDEGALANVRRELEALNQVVASQLAMSEQLLALRGRLAELNGVLWDVEDDIRACEHVGDFGETFVRLARSVYQYNDRRAQVKREINILTASGLIEEKSYR